MPHIESETLAFELSDRWTVFEDRGQIVGHGPDNTEVIVSLVKAENQGNDLREAPEFGMAKERMLGMMRKNASHSELTTTSDVTEIQLENGLSLISLASITTDKQTIFNQFLLIGSNEMMYVTYEGPTDAAECESHVTNALATAKSR